MNYYYYYYLYTEYVARILDDASEILHAHLNINNVLQTLNDRHVLSPEEMASIVKNRDLGARVQMFLIILKTKGIQEYDEFMMALCKFDHDLYVEVKKVERRYPDIHQYC